MYNYFIPGAIRALCARALSTVVNPMRLMLLAMVLFGAAPQMIALPAKVVMAFTCVDAMYFLPISLYVNVKVFKKRV